MNHVNLNDSDDSSHDFLFNCLSNIVIYDQIITRKQKRNDMNIHDNFEIITILIIGDFIMVAASMTNDFKIVSVSVINNWQVISIPMNKTIIISNINKWQLIRTLSSKSLFILDTEIDLISFGIWISLSFVNDHDKLEKIDYQWLSEKTNKDLK